MENQQEKQTVSNRLISLILVIGSTELAFLGVILYLIIYQPFSFISHTPIQMSALEQENLPTGEVIQMGQFLQTDPELGWRCRPLLNKTFRIDSNRWMFTIRTDELGFRNHPRNEKNQLTYRIAVVGDSTSFGMAVNNEDAWPALLEARMAPDLECLNYAVPHYSTDQEYLVLKKYVLEMKPDLVLVAVCINDFAGVQNTYAILGEQCITKPRFERDETNPLGTINTAGVGVLRPVTEADHIQLTYRGHHTDWCAVDPDQTDVYEVGKEILFHLLDRMNTAIQEHQSKMGIVVIPFYEDPSWPEWIRKESRKIYPKDTERYRRDLQEYGRKTGIPVIDPTQNFLELAGKKVLTVPEDGHGNRLAHLLIADEVQQTLSVRGLKVP